MLQRVTPYAQVMAAMAAVLLYVRSSEEGMMELEISPGRHFILVVDADAHRGRALAMDLRDAGCYAAFATSAAEALRYALENEPDAIVSGWELPDMAAVELCRRIKSARWETKVILHQEAAKPSSLRLALENGGEDVLSQPVSAGPVLRLLAHKNGSPAMFARNELIGMGSNGRDPIRRP